MEQGGIALVIVAVLALIALIAAVIYVLIISEDPNEPEQVCPLPNKRHWLRVVRW